MVSLSNGIIARNVSIVFPAQSHVFMGLHGVYAKSLRMINFSQETEDLAQRLAAAQRVSVEDAIRQALEARARATGVALEERTRDGVPLQWATTQNNLGNALSTLGERESGTARLEEAVSAYRAALEERTRDRVPLQWGMSLGNQGEAMICLADRKNDVVLATTAFEQINTAYETAQSGGHGTFADYYKGRLPEARSVLDRLSAR
jgi:tetratricopeptide (TPR) repeat protein